MPKKSIINIRGMDCPPEMEDKFNTWYNEKHIPMLLEIGEIKSVTRFERLSDDKEYPKYLAIYEFEDQEAFDRYNNSPQLAVVIEDLKQTFPEGTVVSKWRVQYGAIKTWSR